jgi:hypothetical protein
MQTRFGVARGTRWFTCGGSSTAEPNNCRRVSMRSSRRSKQGGVQTRMSMPRAYAGRASISRILPLGILLLTSCLPQVRGGEAAEGGAVDSSAQSAQSWQQLAEVVLERIDWSKVCDVGAKCATVLVDSVIRRSVAPEDPRKATIAVSSLPSSRLPSAGVHFVLGAREEQGPNLDAALTMVVSAGRSSLVRPPTMEVVVRLLRPRWDDVHIWIRAERRNGVWIVESLEYLYS